MSFDNDDFSIMQEHEPITPEKDIEFYECARCGEINILKNSGKRNTNTRHIRIDDVTYGSLKRFATINGLKLNKALMLLLYNAKTENINYVLSERRFVNKDINKGKLNKKHE